MTRPNRGAKAARSSRRTATLRWGKVLEEIKHSSASLVDTRHSITILHQMDACSLDVAAAQHITSLVAKPAKSAVSLARQGTQRAVW